MAPPCIVGAGLGGLVLGLCLKNKGIPAVICERTSKPRLHSYGIALAPATYRPLLQFLQLDEAAFKARTAVDGHLRGTGKLDDGQFRCHRGRLEELLRQNLAVRWSRRLESIELGRKIAVFEDGQQAAGCIIACDGPHSAARQSLSSLKLQVLPYVVFNGVRKLPLEQYASFVQQHLHGNTSIHTIAGDARLEVSVNDITASQVSLSYTYSRPARRDDPLHRPDRGTGQATETPEEFFAELAALRDLSAPFDFVFDAQHVRQDRLLHWLMRTVEPDASEFTRLADSGVVLIGDAAHATPILGGNGANLAILDAIALAEHIADSGLNSFTSFLEARIDLWKQAVQDSTRKIAEMHNRPSSNI